jgi:hypothetical protein
MIKNAPDDAHTVTPRTNGDAVEKSGIQVDAGKDGRETLGAVTIDNFGHILADKQLIQAEDVVAFVDLLAMQVQIDIKAVLGNQDTQAVGKSAGIDITLPLFRRPDMPVPSVFARSLVSC